LKLKTHVLFVAITLIFCNVLSADSMSNRADSDFFIEISPYGFAKELVEPLPFTVGYYLSESISVGAQIGSINTDYKSGEVEEENAYSNIGLVVRFFPDNSLNISGAVHQRAWGGTLKIAADSGAYAEANLSATSTVATVGIGHQSVSELGFTWGFDWIAVSSAVGSSYKVSHINNQGLSSSQLQLLTDRAKEIADTVNEVSLTPAMLVLNLGWAF
jgi:hypothetical protein